MKRRSLLQLLATFPFGGAFLSASTPVQAAVPTPYVPEPPLSPQKMAQQLWANMMAYMAAEEERAGEACWNTEEARAMARVCFKFCEKLQDWEWSGYFRPEQDHEQFKKVRFEAMKAPVDYFTHPETGELVTRPAMTRKLKTKLNLRALDDMRAYLGIDTEREICEAVAESLALEVQMEIRGDAANGAMPLVYAIYIPPFICPNNFAPPDMSVHRDRMMFRYAKFR